MTNPNVRAMAKDIMQEQAAESYCANGWWPIVVADKASEVIYTLGLNTNRGPSLLGLLGAGDHYWGRMWVHGLAWLMAPNHHPEFIFNHTFQLPENVDRLHDRFIEAYRENLELPHERLLTLTEYSMAIGGDINTLHYGLKQSAKAVAQIDLDRTRREVRVFNESRGTNQ